MAGGQGLEEWAGVLGPTGPQLGAVYSAGLRYVDIAPTGDCLFEAVARSLPVPLPGGVGVQGLREGTATYMADNPDQFMPFVPGLDADTYRREVDRLRVRGTYMTDLADLAPIALAWWAGIRLIVIDEHGDPMGGIMPDGGVGFGPVDGVLVTVLRRGTAGGHYLGTQYAPEALHNPDALHARGDGSTHRYPSPGIHGTLGPDPIRTPNALVLAGVLDTGRGGFTPAVSQDRAVQPSGVNRDTQNTALIAQDGRRTERGSPRSAERIEHRSGAHQISDGSRTLRGDHVVEGGTSYTAAGQHSINDCARQVLARLAIDFPGNHRILAPADPVGLHGMDALEFQMRSTGVSANLPQP